MRFVLMGLIGGCAVGKGTWFFECVLSFGGVGVQLLQKGGLFFLVYFHSCSECGLVS